MNNFEDLTWGDPEAVWTEKKDVTIGEFDKLCSDAWEVKQDIEALAAEVKKKNELLARYQMRILIHMQNHKKKNYDSPYCKVIVQKRFSVNQPKDPENKQQFFNYLRQRGVFEDLVSVNSRTLNSFYQEELAAAKESGDIDFKIPGLGEAKFVETISFKKR